LAIAARTVDTSDCRISYREVGGGPALLCLHEGSPGANGWSSFEPTARDLADLFRVIVPDQPGFGASSPAPDSAAGYQPACARAMAELLGALGVERAHLVGNSLGGGTALMLALEHPELVDRLVLIAPWTAGIAGTRASMPPAVRLLLDYYPGPSVEKMRALVCALAYDSGLEGVTARYEATLAPEHEAAYLGTIHSPPLDSALLAGLDKRCCCYGAARTSSARSRTRSSTWLCSAARGSCSSHAADTPSTSSGRPTSAARSARSWGRRIAAPDGDRAPELDRGHRRAAYPTVLYLHDGGWCAGKIENERDFCAEVAARGFVVVSLDYPLAPEHPFPRAVEDAVYALRWVVRNAARHGGDPERVVVAGSSAGANIGAAAALAVSPGGPAVDGGDLAGVPVALSGTLFLYGVYDFRTLTMEPGEYANLVEMMFNLAYLGPHFLSRHLDPLVSPRHAKNLGRFPPTYLACGARDTLLPQTFDFARALVDAGASTTVSIVPDVDHFIRIRPRPASVAAEVERMTAWLEEHTAT
jgi:acetyl esterase/lipase